MQSYIKILSAHEAQKIAAGEVVERPASVVKELVENALDAGATTITLHIEDGGKKLIRITDNGCGMSLDDARLSIVNHATSKITTVTELTTLSTFGFRGEALASIAAVSHMSLRTKQTTAEHGYELRIEASTIISEQPIAHNSGTDISIKDLFYNVPARRKFLKTRDTEWRAIATLLQAYALDYPQHTFTVYHDNTLVINCTSATTLQERALQLFDTNLNQHLITLTQQTDKNNYTVNGVISNHQFGRYDRSQLYFFVNKRWVKNHKLGQAVIKGYKDVLPTGRYPAAVITITVPSEEVDINIHPRKEEVQFMHPRIVEDLIAETVQQALQQHAHAPLQKQSPHLSLYMPQITTVPVSDVKATLPQAFRVVPPLHTTAYTPPVLPAVATPVFQQLPPLPEPIPEEIIEEQQIPLLAQHEESTPEPQQNVTILGNYATTYILVQTEQGLMLVDQHAAHERILYEQFATRVTQAESIALLFPETLTFSADDYTIIEENLSILQNYGVDISAWSHNSYVIHATPVHLKNQSLKEIVHEIISILRETEHLEKSTAHKLLHHKVQAMMACKAAVKAGDVLNMQEMEKLIQQLLITPNRLTCPHGRPTSWLLSQFEIERKFKRIVS